MDASPATSHSPPDVASGGIAQGTWDNTWSHSQGQRGGPACHVLVTQTRRLAPTSWSPFAIQEWTGGGLARKLHWGGQEGPSHWICRRQKVGLQNQVPGHRGGRLAAAGGLVTTGAEGF